MFSHGHFHRSNEGIRCVCLIIVMVRHTKKWTCI